MKDDQYIENLSGFFQKDNLILVSSNPLRIIAAINQDFMTIPVLPFETFYKDDIQLTLLENYVMSNKTNNHILADFKFMIFQSSLGCSRFRDNESEGELLFRGSGAGQDQIVILEEHSSYLIEENSIKN